MWRQSSGKTTILLVLLIVISLGLAGGVFYLFQQEQAKALKLEDDMEELNAKYTMADGEVQKLKSLLDQRELDLKDFQGKIDALNEQIKQEQEAKKVAQEDLEKAKAELDTQKNLRVKLEGELNLAQSSLKKAQTKLKELEGKKVLLESQVGALEQKAKEEDLDVELGTIVVAPETPTPAVSVSRASTKTSRVSATPKTSAQASDGKVLIVNREFNFVVINLGSKDGVANGEVFYVYHNNKYIGDITIEKVHDSMAAAGFVSPDLEDKISEGDRVAKKKNR